MMTDHIIKDISMHSKFLKDQYYTQKREINVIKANESLEIMASPGTKITFVESIEKILTLTKNINSKISKDINEFFPILTNWESLSFNEKCQEYSSHICNELNIFIYFKDREFFNIVIEPFIQSKLIKCFIDKWLLHEDLIEYVEDPLKFELLNAFELILLFHHYKEDRIIGEKLKEGINIKIKIIEKENKYNNYDNKNKKIFDTIIENGEEVNEKDDNSFDSDDSDSDDSDSDDSDSDIYEMVKATNYRNEVEDEDEEEDEQVEEEDEEEDEQVEEEEECEFEFDQMKEAGKESSDINTDDDEKCTSGGRVLYSSNLNDSPVLLGMNMNSDVLNKLNDFREKIEKKGPIFYEKIEKTTVWSEMGHWKSSILDNVDIKMNPFWKDVFESFVDNGEIVSKNFICSIYESFTELIYACAVMDLPLKDQNYQEISLNNQIYKINTKSNIIVLSKQLIVNIKKNFL